MATNLDPDIIPREPFRSPAPYLCEFRLFGLMTLWAVRSDICKAWNDQREGDTRRILLECEEAQRRQKRSRPGITKAHATGGVKGQAQARSAAPDGPIDHSRTRARD